MNARRIALPLAAGLLAAGCRPAAAPEAGHATVAVTEATFASEVDQAAGLVVVDFWAAWCGPCRAIAPTLEKLAAEYQGRVKIAKVDVDRNAGLAERFKVRGIPMLVMFRDGQVADTLVGARGEAEYRAWLERYLAGGGAENP
jgi:thioredoxin 1